MKLLFAILIYALILEADSKCSIDYSILYSIKQIERHPKRDIGYQYLISFNSNRDKRLAKSKLKLNWIDSRSVDCLDIINCESTLKKIIDIGVDNLDLGPFQINYKYHKMNLVDYFSSKASMQRACAILEGLIKRYGMSADTIARYHSSTPIYKNRYEDKLFKYFTIERAKLNSDYFFYYYK